MKKNTIGRNGGFALAELLLATMIATTLFASIAFYIDGQRRERAASEHAAWMAQYVNALAGYMADEGANPPATLIQNGTDWLKSNTCGGLQAPDAYFLGCHIPTDFNTGYGLGIPSVTFDWSNVTAPKADITFGVVQTGGDTNAKMAALLAAEANQRLEVDGYQHAGMFAIDPGIDPAVDPAGFQAEVVSANLRGFIDTSITSTAFVRRDGNTIMTGSLITEHNNWSIIGRNEDSIENADPQDPVASANLNDVFIRSAGPLDGGGNPVGMWASEIHELAEEAYRLAVRAPLFVTNVRSGASVSKPTCPTTLTPKIYAQPAGFIGGPTISDARLISGIRTRVNDLGASWRVYMDALYEGEAGFMPMPEPPSPDANMALIQVTVKCGS